MLVLRITRRRRWRVMRGIEVIISGETHQRVPTLLKEHLKLTCGFSFTVWTFLSPEQFFFWRTADLGLDPIFEAITDFFKLRGCENLARWPHRELASLLYQDIDWETKTLNL